MWPDFLEEEFTHAIINCCNSSAFSPDKVSWRYLKHIIKNKLCLKNIVFITNVCFELGYWPSHFKKSMQLSFQNPTNSPTTH